MGSGGRLPFILALAAHGRLGLSSGGWRLCFLFRFRSLFVHFIIVCSFCQFFLLLFRRLYTCPPCPRCVLLGRKCTVLRYGRERVFFAESGKSTDNVYFATDVVQIEKESAFLIWWGLNMFERY